MAERSFVQLTLRIPEHELDTVENWRRAQRRIPSLTVALRTLIERGVKTEQGKAA